MGNVTAGGVNDGEEDDSEFFEDGPDSSLSSGDIFEGTLDVGVLFDHGLLRDAASKIKEEPNESILQQHSSNIIRWLEERRTRHEEFVSLSQFTDMLVAKGASKEDCVELFNQFDAEGEGYADVETFLETLQAFGGGLSSKGDLRTSSKTLQNCCLTPGFVDAFADNKEAVLNHGRKLLKFLLRNRANSTSLPLPALEGFCNTSEMRLKVLQAHMDVLKEKADIKKKVPSIEEGEVLRPLMKCYTGIEVSSNKGDISRLTNGDPSTYWQSDGPARSHWVRLRMRPNVVLKQLSVNVGSSDQSYMPQHVVVAAGRDEQNLREISDVRVPSHANGDFVLVENVKIPYPVIQINIRRCHSDGCDTRIRGIKAVGYRVLRSKGMSVGDASAVWFLSVLGATASAAMPLAPHLKDVILANTRAALSHIKPMSLSITSPDRPAFLSQNVLEEIENFLQSIVRYGGSIQPESLRILLEFTLARGNLKSIFKVLKLLYEITHEDFTAADIINSLEDVHLRATKQHGGFLKMSLTSCDGGHKDNFSKPENVLSENWSSEAYLSETGKKHVTLMFSSAASVRIKLTRLIIKVSKGDIGPSSGIVFVLDDLKRDEKEKEKEGQAQEADPLNKFNDWTKATYTDYLASSTDKADSEQDEPVAFFTTEEDWDEVEVHVDSILTGKYVVVKFLGARKESAERIGVLGINFFGYEVKPNCPLNDNLQLNEVAPLPSGDTVEGSILFIRVLSFLDEMAKDQAILKSRPKNPPVFKEKEGQLEMSSASLELIWEVYTLITSRGVKHKKIVVGCLLLLRLLHQSLPYLKSNIRDLAVDSTDKKAFEQQQELAAQVFAHLCDVVDDDKQLYDDKIHQISKLIILEGAELFFPDSQTRRNHLLSMVDQVMEEKKAVSLGLTFESLCRFFSNKDASGLLGLPDSVAEEGFNYCPVIAVMTTLLSVAFQECQNCLVVDSTSHDHTTSNLVQLLCAMQRSLLTWCSGQIKSGSSFGHHVATSLITDYVGILASKVHMSLQAVHGMKDQLAVIDRLEHSYVSASTRQLVLFLNLFTNVDALCMPVLRSLQPVSLELKKFSHDFPELFFKIDSEEWNKAQGQTVLRTWEVESVHNYENNQDITTVFSCPGCSEFTVDFDPRCETERRYDYLEFTDSNGNKKRLDQKVGTDKWPKTISFKAGNRLLFTFHSDGSNNEWGYKFTVTAKGSPDIALSWIFDLQLGMARLFGQLCSAALDSRKASPTLSNGDSEEETKLLHSEIWTTLFRGGYMTGKLQRSLSGYHATTSSPVENSVNVFLHFIISGEGGSTELLLKRCHEKSTGPSIGGALVDKAINSVFAALIWHSQELRDQIVLYANNTPPETVPAGIQEAYLTAESLRRSLVDRRQRLILQAEEESNQETSPSKKTNPDAPVIACMEKAQFLLKFAGLQRICEKTEGRENRRSKWLNRKTSWQRSSVEHGGGLLSGPRQRSLSVEEIRTIDKHPAFKLILDFVTNDSYSHERIEALLQQRVKHANSVADIYLFAAEFLRISSDSDLVQAPAVLFLQQFLASQKRFPSHYANNLDGCGLSLESKVRRAYYALVRRCLDGVRPSHLQSTTQRPSSTAFECLRAYVLHLLDTEWKPYDHTFILDVHLPEFLLDTAKATVVQQKSEGNDLSEQQELDHYEEGTKWLNEAKTDFDAWFTRIREESQTHQQRRRMHLFVARFSDSLSVVITCNGCDDTLSGRRYRCLNCLDVDLCNNCYLGGTKPEGHLDSHDVIDMRYKCDECHSFIVGTRFHCNDCEDFDLCIGCHSFGKFPSRHGTSHKVTKFPLKTDTAENTATNNPISLVQNYTHHHAWLQFAALVLTLANTVNEPAKTAINPDYLRTAGLLHMECFDLITKSLTYAVQKAEQAGGTVEGKGSTKADTTTIAEGVATEGTDPSTTASSADAASQAAATVVMTSTAGEVTVEDTDSSTEASTVGTTEVGASSASAGSSVECTDSSMAATAAETTCQVATEVVPSTGDSAPIEQSPSKEGDSGDASETVAEQTNAAEPSADTATGTKEAEPAPSSTAGQDKEDADVGAGATAADVSVGTEQELKGQSEEGKVSEAAASQADQEVHGGGDEGKGVSTKESSGIKSVEDIEKLFASGSQERLLGLLGAILPQDSKLSHWTKCCSGIEDFVSETFLPALLKIIREGNNDDKTQSLALGILGKFLQCTNPDVSDRGVAPYYTSPVKTESESSSEERSSGKATVKFLFQLGAEYLARSDLNASSGMATTLQQLASSHQWQPSVADHVGLCLENLAQSTENVDLSAVFGLLVFARFPDVVRMGSVTEMKDLSGENRKVVVFRHYPDKAAVTVLDVKSRKRKTVKEHLLNESAALSEAFKTSRFSVLLEIVVKILKMLKEKKAVPVERMWVLYLALKGLLGNLKANFSLGLNVEMISSGIVPLLVSIACRGTTFSSQWLLRDLEVLSLKLYKSEKMPPAAPVEETSSKDEAKSAAKPSQEPGVVTPATETTTATVVEAAGPSEQTEEGGHDPFEGLNDDTKTCFETIREAMNVPSAVLRAIYENVGHDQSRLLVEVQRGFDGSTFQVSDELKEQAKKWEPVEEKEKQEDAVTVTDTALDIGVVRYTTKEILPESVQAKPEESDVAQKLIPILSDAEIAETHDKQARTKSAELLKKELENEKNPGCTEYLSKCYLFGGFSTLENLYLKVSLDLKVNLALSVIYSRHLLALLLGEWPEGHRITADLMDSSDEVQLVGLLDILQRLENKELFKKVVTSVVRCGDPKLVHPLSLAAAHCMGEVTLSTETRESTHNYSNDTKDEGKVHIAGAAMLFVKFDPRCATEDGCDELVISSSPDYEQNRHVFSGPHSRWIDVELPGDILYYMFTSDGTNNDWGWKFIVTGGQLGRFKTGFTVLNALLSLDNKVARSLPLKKLWVWLVSVACCQTGQQRLMATGLLLRLLLVVSGQALDSDGSCCAAMGECERPDLSLLKPLWALYTSMLEKEGGPGSGLTLVPPVLRGLTELFLVVENLAQDWGMAEDLVVGFTTIESLKRCFSQAVQKVGLIGLAIGQPNMASEALIKAASNPPPAQDSTDKGESKQAKGSSFSEYEIPFTLTFGGDENEDDTTSDSTSDDSDDHLESE